MKRTREKRSKKSMPNGKKMAIVVAIFVIVFGAVFLTLFLTRERLAYSEAKDYVSGMLNTRELINKFIDTAPRSLEFSDEEQRIVDDFDAALEKNRSYMESLAVSSALKDEAVNEKYLLVKDKYGAIERLAAVWGDTKKLLDMTDENLLALKESRSEKLKELAEELIEYRLELKNYKAKYSGSSDAGMIEEYGKLQLIGDEINEKYRNTTIEEILGMSRDDIASFYATIEELNNVLAERV